MNEPSTLRPRQLPLSISLDDDMTRHNWLSRPDTAALEQWLFDDGGSAYLGGESGVGKSHLLQALCHEHGDALYLPLPELLDMPPMALLEGTEGASLLAIDGLEVVVGRPDWQEALFHLFNRALQTQTRLVMAGLVAPANLDDLLPDLRSRLESLPLFALPRFSEEALDALLQLRAQRRGITLSVEVRGWLLRRAPRDPAALMTLLDTLDRESLARGRQITIPLLRELRFLES
ncbi:MAG: DnaA regulatory inactivator Hda [Halieaceae bacterium]|nr:DnaA regulatory inactivator Hda [Halieaceae bacterium]